MAAVVNVRQGNRTSMKSMLREGNAVANSYTATSRK